MSYNTCRHALSRRVCHVLLTLCRRSLPYIKASESRALSNYSADMREDLAEKILPYWHDTTLDRTNGGYILSDDFRKTARRHGKTDRNPEPADLDVLACAPQGLQHRRTQLSQGGRARISLSHRQIPRQKKWRLFLDNRFERESPQRPENSLRRGVRHLRLGRILSCQQRQGGVAPFDGALWPPATACL